MALTELPDSLPRARAVQAALATLVQALDDAKAAGCTIPPVSALGVTNVAVGLLTIAGTEAQALGRPSPFANAHGPAILASITPSPVPSAFVKAGQ